jgi:hypothetical protein
MCAHPGEYQQNMCWGACPRFQPQLQFCTFSFLQMLVQIEKRTFTSPHRPLPPLTVPPGPPQHNPAPLQRTSSPRSRTSSRCFAPPMPAVRYSGHTSHGGAPSPPPHHPTPPAPRLLAKSIFDFRHCGASKASNCFPCETDADMCECTNKLLKSALRVHEINTPTTNDTL